VVASKRFTIQDPPVALTIHLKRFSPLGRKIGHPVRYDERLSLAHVVSEGQYGPSYLLYGVISHAGSGPNSGHYYAHVKAPNDHWYEMNDDSVTRYHTPPTSMKNAYILFYMRDRGQALQAAVTSGSQRPPVSPHGVRNKLKKKRIPDMGTNTGEKRNQPFIGPILPSSTIPEPVPSVLPARDPQADLLKRKIQAASKPTRPQPKPSNALLSLSQYVDEDDDAEDIGERVQTSSPTLKEALPTSTPSTASIPSIPPRKFYGSSPSAPGTKRKLQDDEQPFQQRLSARRFKTPASVTMHRPFGLQNPFARTSSVKNSMQGRHGKKRFSN